MYAVKSIYGDQEDLDATPVKTAASANGVEEAKVKKSKAEKAPRAAPAPVEEGKLFLHRLW